MSRAWIINGNALRLPLADCSVQCVVTSPPYWGLRDYGVKPSVWGGDAGCAHEWGAHNRTAHANAVHGPNSKGKNGNRYSCETKTTGPFCTKCGAWFGCHGLEPTPDLYVQHEVMIFREVRRVLRDDGIAWINLGDSYNAYNENAGPGSFKAGSACDTERPHLPSGHGLRTKSLKPKDLVGIPWRVAFALQDDGWYLRQDIIWHKPSPMPESVTDRCTKAHEYIFLVAKSERYYYDAEAIMEACSENTHPRLPGNVRPPKGEAPYNAGDGHHRTKAGLLAYAQRKRAEAGNGIKNNRDFDAAMAVMPARRNKRSVWTVTSQSYKGAHFATFPEKLVEPCILAGTSAKGCCPKCGSGWVRVIEKERVATRPGNDSKVTDYRSSPHEDSPYNDHGGMICGNRDPKRHCTATKTVSWKPGCKCDAGEPVPCVVLDPFAGTCTTGRVAIDHGRRFVGIELKPDYIALANERVKVTPPLFIGE